MYRIEPHPQIDSDVPPLVKSDLRVSHFEFWPPWLFYLPMKLYGLLLALRYGPAVATVTNPSFEAGGFAGESKSQILDLVKVEGEKWFAKHLCFVKGRETESTYARATQLIRDKDFVFPIVGKPDVGCRGLGVQLLETEEDLKNYISQFPVGEKVQLQELFDYPNEAGVFYIRRPGERRGRIFSLTLKYFPVLECDGKSTLEQLILNDSRAGQISHIYLERHKDKLNIIYPRGHRFRLAFTGSHSLGTIFKDGNRLITSKMERLFDEISATVPEFYFGRYDVRFHRLEDLETGENMKIIEINGATSEATHIWDSGTGLWEAYKTLMEQYLEMFRIGALNRKRGFRPLRFFELIDRINVDKRRFQKYPLTH